MEINHHNQEHKLNYRCTEILMADGMKMGWFDDTREMDEKWKREMKF
jgi:hypothetical protein